MWICNLSSSGICNLQFEQVRRPSGAGAAAAASAAEAPVDPFYERPQVSTFNFWPHPLQGNMVQNDAVHNDQICIVSSDWLAKGHFWYQNDHDLSTASRSKWRHIILVISNRVITTMFSCAHNFFFPSEVDQCDQEVYPDFLDLLAWT